MFRREHIVSLQPEIVDSVGLWLAVARPSRLARLQARDGRSMAMPWCVPAGTLVPMFRREHVFDIGTRMLLGLNRADGSLVTASAVPLGDGAGDQVGR